MYGWGKADATHRRTAKRVGRTLRIVMSQRHPSRREQPRPPRTPSKSGAPAPSAESRPRSRVRSRVPRPPRAPLLLGAAHPVDHRLWHAHAGQLVRHEFGVPQALERRDRREHRNPERLDAARETARARRASNTGCVMTNSAPASTLYASRRSSSSGSSAPGLAATPMWNAVGTPMLCPPMSDPRFNRVTTFVSPIESTSNTPVASG